MTDRNIQFSEAAAISARLMAQDPENATKVLRLYIEGKGCDGFVYGICFDNSTDKDIHFPQGGVDLVVDPETLVFVEGSRIDWVDDERGRGFLVENPKHRKFRGKFFKRDKWQEWLSQRRDSIERQHDLKS